MKNIFNPPSWAPNAVPSDRGWRHPVTGELLVSVRGGVIESERRVKQEVPSILEILPEEEVLVEEVAVAVIDETVASEEVLPEEVPVETLEEEEEDKPKRKAKNVK